MLTKTVGLRGPCVALCLLLAFAGMATVNEGYLSNAGLVGIDAGVVVFDAVG